MRRVDVVVIAGLLILVAMVTLLLILAGGAVAASFALGFAVLFGLFLVGSLFSSRYGRREPHHPK